MGGGGSMGMANAAIKRNEAMRRRLRQRNFVGSQPNWGNSLSSESPRKTCSNLIRDKNRNQLRSELGEDRKKLLIASLIGILMAGGIIKFLMPLLEI